MGMGDVDDRDVRRIVRAENGGPGGSAGQGVGTLGRLGTFSFQASKNLNAGEGGAIVTNDAEVAEVVWSLHNVGREMADFKTGQYVRIEGAVVNKESREVSPAYSVRDILPASPRQ